MNSNFKKMFLILSAFICVHLRQKCKIMKIGIIGAGNIGGNAAKLFAEAGHEIAIANSRSPETLADFVNEIGGNAKAVTAEEAAEFGEIVVCFDSARKNYRNCRPADLTGKS